LYPRLPKNVLNVVTTRKNQTLSSVWLSSVHRRLYPSFSLLNHLFLLLSSMNDSNHHHNLIEPEKEKKYVRYWLNHTNSILLKYIQYFCMYHNYIDSSSATSGLPYFCMYHKYIDSSSATSGLQYFCMYHKYIDSSSATSGLQYFCMFHKYIDSSSATSGLPYFSTWDSKIFKFENLSFSESIKIWKFKISLSGVKKYHNPLVAGDSVSYITKTSKISLSC
jgi:hypothetical protein